MKILVKIIKFIDFEYGTYIIFGNVRLWDSSVILIMLLQMKKKYINKDENNC